MAAFPLVGDSVNPLSVNFSDPQNNLNFLDLSPMSSPGLEINEGLVPLQASPFQLQPDVLFPLQIEFDTTPVVLHSLAEGTPYTSFLNHAQETSGLLGSEIRVGFSSQTQDSLLNPQTHWTSGTQPDQEIIFIDAGVEDAASLMQGIRPGAEVVWLAADQDGITQMTEVLAQRQGLTAIHIVAHGSEGSVRLGNAVLSQETLGQYTQALQGWGAALTQDADLLFYGCNVAGNGDGVAFINQIANLTGADVAASDDLTGNTALGGDWDLEVATGAVEVDVAFSQSALDAYQHTLASLLIDNNSDRWGTKQEG